LFFTAMLDMYLVLEVEAEVLRVVDEFVLWVEEVELVTGEVDLLDEVEAVED
jgi:hypothetical protein